jgi:hypothetical protein
MNPLPNLIKLKSVKIAHFASEETLCFRATLYIEGVKRGEVSNDGCGGAHRFSDFDAQQLLDEMGSELPPEPSNLLPDGLAWNAERLIDAVLHDHLIEAELKKKLTRKCVFVKDHKLMETAVPKGRTLAEVVAFYQQNRERADVILNALPFSAALRVYALNAVLQNRNG